jgi:hypothetical protein
MAEFDQIFDDFIDGEAYDRAADALLKIARASFKAGWLAAGGENPDERGGEA